MVRSEARQNIVTTKTLKHTIKLRNPTPDISVTKCGIPEFLEMSKEQIITESVNHVLVKT